MRRKSWKKMLTKKVVIVPCSGVGKPFGTITRKAAYQVTEDDRPEDTRIIPLSLLVLGDENAQDALTDADVISLDGCALICATKMVQESGGKVSRSFNSMEVYRANRKLKPKGIAELNDAGLALARKLAEQIDRAVDELSGKADGNA
jgi:uncharacterized metal-binding protein